MIAFISHFEMAKKLVRAQFQRHLDATVAIFNLGMASEFQYLAAIILISRWASLSRILILHLDVEVFSLVQIPF